MSESIMFNRRRFLQGSVIGGASLALPAVHAAPNDRITVGFIGVGSRAVGLMRDSQATGQCAITTVCDAYTGRVTAARERLGSDLRVTDDYRELLARPDIDAVVIATPDHWHVRMVEDALAAGKHVYIEKPMTYTVDEGNAIRAAVEKSGTILQVGSQGVSSTVEAEARSIIRSGRLGQITMLRANYNRNSASGAWIYPIPPDASEKTVNWEMFLGPAPKQPFSLERFFRWRCYWDYSGGIATDLFVHLCTTVHFLMDATMPEMVSARGSLYRWTDSREVPDTLNAVLEYPEGFTLALGSSFNSSLNSGSGFEILGTEGALILRGNSIEVHTTQQREDNGWIVSAWPRALRQAYYEDPDVRRLERRNQSNPPVSGNRSETLSFEGIASTQQHFENFFAAIRSGQQPYEDATRGHRAASCAHLINTSIRRGTPVGWDFTTDTMTV